MYKKVQHNLEENPRLLLELVALPNQSTGNDLIKAVARMAELDKVRKFINSYESFDQRDNNQCSTSKIKPVWYSGRNECTSPKKAHALNKDTNIQHFNHHAKYVTPHLDTAPVSIHIPSSHNIKKILKNHWLF